MIRMNRCDNARWKVGRPYLSLGAWEGNCRRNIYRHPAGLVEILEYTGQHPITSIRFYWKGYEHIRRWDCLWGDRTLSRLSREFIESVVKEWADGHRGSF